MDEKTRVTEENLSAKMQVAARAIWETERTANAIEAEAGCEVHRRAGGGLRASWQIDDRDAA